MDDRIERLLDELETPEHEREAVRRALSPTEDERRSREAHPSGTSAASMSSNASTVASVS
ncbi:MAG: hypothetical protein JWM34_2889 [Ilumatobacteraceae bacterium]|nr:hypothetical protein [Ilumatobacteraceae bacterium]